MICEIPVHSLITVLIHNSGHFGPPLPFWAPALPGLPMASYATAHSVWYAGDRHWQYLRRSTFARQRPWTTYHHIKRPPLCTAECAWNSASRRSICDSWYFIYKPSNKDFKNVHGPARSCQQANEPWVGSGHALKGQTRFRLCFVA